MADGQRLERFVAAQDAGGTYDRALAELRAGQKTSHWMWFIFPQIAGLGRSPTARIYAITSLQEAQDYLQHPVLGPRVLACAGTVAGIRGRTALQIFGSIDAQKLRSSMTLFQRAAVEGTAPHRDAVPSDVFSAVLERYFDGSPDPETDRLLDV
ncbi:DUF1810 domain-containing protein [Paenarthrobacter sp. Z7-10]|uniref:DUF1810 domain-containing protein n=1 Tax=Paenarthrobacter sp. Z7-10 TaxID=2787635 RepID=UPI0022A969F2|nr:DUF1810 domain-containing protein [Paenarthrobacter sp. Z7-10]MCZ2403190.1 DUF1810 domain-containing protein [Paenarthrobacter sp. Z7-10]